MRGSLVIRRSFGESSFVQALGPPAEERGRIPGRTIPLRFDEHLGAPTWTRHSGAALLPAVDTFLQLHSARPPSTGNSPMGVPASSSRAPIRWSSRTITTAGWRALTDERRAGYNAYRTAREHTAQTDA
jgi:hypothetical protein